MNKSHDIWKILTRNVPVQKLGKTITTVLVDDNPDKSTQKPPKVQIFELLVAETLNLYDNNILWEITRASKDGGVDLYGTSKKIIKTPFSNGFIKEISLGQVKHTKDSGYGIVQVKSDLYKLKSAWLCRRDVNNCTLRQFLFILATSNDKYINKLNNDIEQYPLNRDIVEFKDYANVTLLNGNTLMKSWKLNFSYFKDILKNAITNSELEDLEAFINNQREDWLDININVSSMNEATFLVGETFCIKFSVSNNFPFLDSRLYLKWRPHTDNTIQIMYPLNAADTRSKGVHIKKSTEVLYDQEKEFSFVFRGTQVGRHSLGNIDLCYENNKVMASVALQEVHFLNGFLPNKLIEPTHIKEYDALSNFIKNNNAIDNNFKCFAIIGCGGLGKSTIINELVYTASGNGFSCIAVQHPKDKIHEREVITRLFDKLIFPDSSSIFRPERAVNALKDILRMNFEQVWSKYLLEYFSGKKQVSQKMIAECLATLIITISSDNRLLIWLSDLHWGEQEFFGIIDETLGILDRHQNLLENRVVIIFEGRDGETLRKNDLSYSPDNWLNFLENGFLNIINLPFWNKQMCEEFVKSQFSSTLNDNIKDFINKIIQSSNSVPMHIVQNINLMLENKILGFDCNHQLIILKSFNNELFSSDIITTIMNRIDYYEKKFKIYVELLVIAAKWNDNINPQMNDWIIDKLNLTESNKILIKQSGFLEDFHNSVNIIKFRHEHYLNAFNEYHIKNDSLIDECISFYSALPDLNDDDKLNIIELKRLYSIKDYDSIYNDAFNLLQETQADDIRLAAYKIIDQIQDNVPVVKIPKYEVYFEICELILRNGNWDDGLTYLNKVFDIKEDCIENILCYLRSYQEYANIQADRLLFDDSIEKAELGIELADRCLNDKKYELHYNIISLLKEKLQARLAVCYWFSGDFNLAYKTQEACLQSATRRGDLYSSAHIAYEMSTLEFHWDYEKPATQMQEILLSFDDKPIPYLEHEKTLIETQLLIGEVLYAIKNNNDVTPIISKTTELIDFYRLQPHIYEEYLCRTIRALCYFHMQNYDECLNDLVVALNKSTFSNMPNLEWKAYVNMAQFLHFKKDKNCIHYALKAVDLFSTAIELNKKTALTFKRMVASATDILENILHKELPRISFKDKRLDTTQSMLAANVNGITFFIMN